MLMLNSVLEKQIKKNILLLRMTNVLYTMFTINSYSRFFILRGKPRHSHLSHIAFNQQC